MKLLFSTTIALVLILLTLLALSGIYNSSVVHDGPAYPIVENALKLLPINTNPIPEKKDCFEEAYRVRKAVQQYRSCADVSECKFIPHGYVDALVVNKVHANTVTQIFEELNKHCDDRPSHADLYSLHGLKLQCANQKCSLHDISSEEKHQELSNETLEAIRTE